MPVNEYLDKITQLSRYAPEEVNTDPKRQEHFLDGLIGPLNYQLQSHSFPNFATLLNKAIGLVNKRVEFGEQKPKFQSHGQSSNTRPRFNSLQVSQFSSGDQEEIIRKIRSCSVQPSSPSTPTNRHHMMQVIIRIAQVH
jgi:hypothetical protein